MSNKQRELENEKRWEKEQWEEINAFMYGLGGFVLFVVIPLSVLWLLAFYPVLWIPAFALVLVFLGLPK